MSAIKPSQALFAKVAPVSEMQFDASKAPLLQLPTELIYCITDNLELHDAYLFSQTCRAVHLLTHGHVEATLRAIGIFQEVVPSSGCVACTKRRICSSCITFEELVERKKKSTIHRQARFAFWAGIANHLPDRWACPSCKYLHPIHQKNQQSFRNSVKRFCNARSGRYLPVLDQYCAAREAQIQLALKRTRFGDFHKKYLEGLMEPSQYVFAGYPHARKDEYCSWRYEATPKVINERSMLQEEWVVSMHREMRLRPYSLWFIELCPHMATVDGGSLSRNSLNRHGLTNFREAVQYAVRMSQRGPQAVLGHCPLCLTDYRVSFDGSETHVTAWYDFGSYSSPADEAWMANGRNRGTQESPPQRHQEFSHNRGEVRRMFVTGKPYSYESQHGKTHVLKDRSEE